MTPAQLNAYLIWAADAPVPIPVEDVYFGGPTHISPGFLPYYTVTEGGMLTIAGLAFVENATGMDINLVLSDGLVPFVTIKDNLGNAGAYNITVSYSGGIDAGTSFVLAVDWQWVTLAWTGSSYAVIG